MSVSGKISGGERLSAVVIPDLGWATTNSLAEGGKVARCSGERTWDNARKLEKRKDERMMEMKTRPFVIDPERKVTTRLWQMLKALNILGDTNPFVRLDSLLSAAGNVLSNST